MATNSITGSKDPGLNIADIYNDEGQTKIKIGFNAGLTNQAANSIVLNATGTALNNTITQSTVIKPIRADAVNSHILSYNDTSGEIIKSTIAQVKTAVSEFTEQQKLYISYLPSMISFMNILSVNVRTGVSLSFTDISQTYLVDTNTTSTGTLPFTYTSGIFTITRKCFINIQTELTTSKPPISGIGLICELLLNRFFT